MGTKRSVRLHLRGRADGMWLGRLDALDVPAEEVTHVVVRLVPGATGTDRAVPNIRVACWTQIVEVLQAGGQRVPIGHVPPPIWAEPAEGEVWLALRTEHASWRAILAERTIAAYVPALHWAGAVMLATTPNPPTA